MMASATAVWRQRAWVWGTALSFLGLSVFAFLIYEVGYANRVGSLRTQLRAQGSQLAEQRSEEQRLVGLLRQARLNRERIWQLYDDHFSTRRHRLTGITTEVKSLASRAGLRPRSFTYPEEQIQEYGLVKRSFVFNVEGSYADLRKFINLLESSESFLSLDAIGLTEAAPPTVGAVGAAGRPGFPAFATPPVAVRPFAAAPPGGPPLSTARRAAPPRPGMPPAPVGPLPAPPASALFGPGSQAETLHISLRLSTLFSSQEAPRRTDLAPLPGSGVAARGRTTS